jgi:non-lysosomal glucosylceramidase
MCTFPRTDWDYGKAKGKGADWAAGYFNECMNGFEYQVAGHMIWEGMVMEGLAVTRMLHDRYHPARRNPWNEIECGDHYARSMASYGVFLAAAGFSCHGPKRQMGFAPRLTPENFRCAFTAAEGWGTYAQRTEGQGLKAKLEVKWGRVPLQELALGLPQTLVPTGVTAVLGGRTVAAAVAVKDGTAVVRFGEGLVLGETAALEVALT